MNNYNDFIYFFTNESSRNFEMAMVQLCGMRNSKKRPSNLGNESQERRKKKKCDVAGITILTQELVIFSYMKILAVILTRENLVFPFQNMATQGEKIDNLCLQKPH